MKDRTEELRTSPLRPKSGIRDVVPLGMVAVAWDRVLRVRWIVHGPSLWVSVHRSGWFDRSQAIDPARSLFILASKSGGTIEILSSLPAFGNVFADPGQAGRRNSSAIAIRHRVGKQRSISLAYLYPATGHRWTVLVLSILDYPLRP
jgi:hypothetical protein